MHGNIVNLCLNTLLFQSIHKLSAVNADIIKIEKQDIKMETAEAIFGLKGYLNRFDTAKSLVIPVNYFTSAFSKGVKFFQLGKSKCTLNIGNSVVIAQINLFIVPWHRVRSP